MQCLRKIKSENGVKFVLGECTPEEELACIEFRKKYKVKYVSETRGIYGGCEDRTLSYYSCDNTDDKLICIFSDGNLVGCRCENNEFYINGPKSYSQTSDCGPQGPLIWDSVSWELVER